LEANGVGEATSRETATGEDKEQRRKGVEDRTRVKQCRGISTGMYITASVEGVPVQFSVDTGASRTVISTKVFNRVVERKQIELQSSSCLVGASGLPIQEFGTGH
jgi:predicted aspartyl protease